ncbi:bleomycin resistance family protein [Pseudomonas sp. UL073]|uniref:Bleomycin resistance family protein n=1 Tax=Zestomonas insulae TaxID=2809017 RepID=A0ABS2IC93_9GAMM|nr:VOC family protein [Pseudomonas insulae]MBM7060731.1 bleomycin resistance family protein [Pseudomonas insulae]
MSLTLLLRCNNLDETRTFYQAVLCFEVFDTPGTLTAEKHDGKLIFTEQDLWQSQPMCSGTLYFTVPDADGYFASIKDAVTVAWPIQDMPYGSREFGIRDCNGYYLAFQQQD